MTAENEIAVVLFMILVVGIVCMFVAVFKHKSF